MSLHKSLKRQDALVRRRNVLTRAERIARLKEDERWDEENSSVFALPKVKPRITVAPVARARKEEEAEEGELEATEAAEEEQ